MANNKLTWLELRKAVAEHAHCSEQEAEGFLNALLEGVVDGLKTDKQVKIKGLGSFSLKAVAPRKSVNIATGENFTIEGYNKLTFSAESTLKDCVEKRTERPATEEVISQLNNDPIKKLGEQANEIIDILAELGQTPEKTEPTEQPAVAEEPTEETIEETIIEEPIEDPAPVEEVAEEPATIEDVAEEPATTTPSTTKKKCTCGCKWMWWMVGAIILALAVGNAIYFREQIIGWWQCSRFMEKPIKRSQYHDIITSRKGNQTAAAQEDKSKAVDFSNIRETVAVWWESIKFWEKEEIAQPATSVNTQPSTTTTPQSTINTEVSFDDLQYNNTPGIQVQYPGILEEETEEAYVEEVYIEDVYEEEFRREESQDQSEENVFAAAQPASTSLSDIPRVYSQIIATEVVGQDSRLTWISYKYYGSKDLWVFIYEANRDIISNPARVTPGQELRIPKLDNRYLDLNNPELRQLVDQLTAEYLK